MEPTNARPTARLSTAPPEEAVYAWCPTHLRFCWRAPLIVRGALTGWTCATYTPALPGMLLLRLRIAYQSTKGIPVSGGMDVDLPY